MSGAVDNSQDNRLSSNSIIAVIGFSLYTVWALFVCFWLLGNTDNPESLHHSIINRMGAFLGFPVGFLVLGFLGRSPKFNIFDYRILLAAAALTALLPTACSAIVNFFPLPVFISFICIMLSTAAGTLVQVSWLDVLSRFDLSKLGISAGSGTCIGVIIFLLISSMPAFVQDIAACVCILASIGLVAHASKIAPYNDERAPLERTQDKWEFTREIEPSLILFGMIFALCFFYLAGSQEIIFLMGIAGLAVGGIITIAADLSKRVFRITSVQRVIMVITVCTCLLMWIPNDIVRTSLSLIASASCSFLVIANSIFLTRKICTPRDVPVFRAIPKRLLIFSSGFACGWLIAVLITYIPGGTPEMIGYARLGLAMVLIIIMMVYLPVERHHDDTASAAGGHRAYGQDQSFNVQSSTPNTTPVQRIDSSSSDDLDEVSMPSTVHLEPPPVAPAGVSISETEVFDAKCASIAKLYQLSPREAEILPFLARGRNNAYLQKRFIISPHTAKSHIYNIYRKMDIHSQQKLMDFVEEFPDDYDSDA